MRKVIFGIGIFWILMGAFIFNGFGYGEPFWERRCDKLIAWYERKGK